MSDRRDVVREQLEADSRRSSLETLAGRIEESEQRTDLETVAFVIALGAAGIMAELRALEIVLDYHAGELGRHLGALEARTR